LIRLLDPLLRTWWRGYGLGNVVELHVPGRRTGRERRVLLGLLRDDGSWFLGHPNGDTPWTLNLAAAGGGRLSLAPPTSIAIRARRLPPGDERDRAILATWQHPFPGNLVYRLA
jgi:F420H(2)-dependent quinone reductase